LRAVQAEGRPRPEVARTLVNLFMYLRSGPRVHQSPLSDEHETAPTRPVLYPTLESLVRSYAQPVNPRWYPDGSKIRERLPSLTPADRATVLKRAAARRDVHSTRIQFDRDTHEAVERALSSGWGLDWTDYAAPSMDRTAEKKYTRRTESRAGYNTFWTRAPGWGGYTAESGGTTGGPLIACVLATLCFWAATRV